MSIFRRSYQQCQILTNLYTYENILHDLTSYTVCVLYNKFKNIKMDICQFFCVCVHIHTSTHQHYIFMCKKQQEEWVSDSLCGWILLSTIFLTQSVLQWIIHLCNMTVYSFIAASIHLWTISIFIYIFIRATSNRTPSPFWLDAEGKKVKIMNDCEQSKQWPPSSLFSSSSAAVQGVAAHHHNSNPVGQQDKHPQAETQLTLKRVQMEDLLTSWPRKTQHIRAVVSRQQNGDRCFLTYGG